MKEEQVQPVAFTFKRDERLEIQWSDGRSGAIPLDRLRRECPCAGCRQERTERASNPLTVLPSGRDEAAMIAVDRAELAGNYAIKIVWKDGHNTGIYDFGLLRRLST